MRRGFLTARKKAAKSRSVKSAAKRLSNSACSMRDEQAQVRDGHVLRNAPRGLQVVRTDHVREGVPGARGKIVIARCADLIDAVLQGTECGSFEGHIQPF
jgi:hypothetical protein